jgi:hypothetical protein
MFRRSLAGGRANCIIISVRRDQDIFASFLNDREVVGARQVPTASIAHAFRSLPRAMAFDISLTVQHEMAPLALLRLYLHVPHGTWLELHPPFRKPRLEQKKQMHDVCRCIQIASNRGSRVMTVRRWCETSGQSRVCRVRLRWSPRYVHIY